MTAQTNGVFIGPVGKKLVCTNIYTQTWILSDFDSNFISRHKDDECLTSPHFAIPGIRGNWRFELYPNKDSKFLALQLFRKFSSSWINDRVSQSGYYSVSILNDKNEKFNRRSYHFFHNSWEINLYNQFIEHKDLLNDANKLLINNELKIHVELICTSNSNMDKWDDVQKLFLEEKFSDLKLVTACGKELKAHKIMLAARSPAFSAMFEHKMAESESSVVKIDDIEHDVLKEMLKYIYTNKIEKYALELLVAADKYGMEDLKAECLHLIYEKIEDIINVENAIDMYEVADKIQDTDQLKRKIMEFMEENITEVVESNSFKEKKDFGISILVNIIRMNNTDFVTDDRSSNSI